jgi:NAD(P)-dependent dehydrogenase (short-subunit alcohol dehydrogenase family)
MFLKHVPLNRMALPEEIANAVLFFASDESKYITGQVLAVAGGFDIATPLYGDFIGKDRSK